MKVGKSFSQFNKNFPYSEYCVLPPAQSEGIRRLLEQAINVLTPLLPLANGHLAHFFTHQHWHALVPSELKSELSHIFNHGRALADRHGIRGGNGQTSDRWPSLADLSDYPGLAGFRYHLARQSLNALTRAHPHLFDPLGLEPRLVTQQPSIERRYITRMKLKKKQEVMTVATAIMGLRQELAFNTLIDIGCGLGHLGRIISENAWDTGREPLRVVGIEGNDAIFKSCLKRSQDMDNESLLNVKITSAVDLTTTVQRAARNDNHVPQDYFLVGLHACGGLSTSILKAFSVLTHSEKACRGMLLLGCCYHKVKERLPRSNENLDFRLDYFSPNSTSVPEFPLSHYGTKRDVVIGQNARMLTNQPLSGEEATELEVPRTHFLRALLELILKDEFDVVAPPIRLMKKAMRYCESDADYLRLGLARVGLHLGLGHLTVSDQILGDYLSVYDPLEWQLAAFYSLRRLLGPVVETVVLLDRLLFLLEAPDTTNSNWDSSLLRFFDPSMSPRCWGLLALRR